MGRHIPQTCAKPAELTEVVQFFDQLEKLFKHRDGQDHGAIYLSQKRCQSRPRSVHHVQWRRQAGIINTAIVLTP